LYVVTVCGTITGAAGTAGAQSPHPETATPLAPQVSQGEQQELLPQLLPLRLWSPLASPIAGARKIAPTELSAMDAIKKRFFIQDLPLNCVPRGQTGTPGEMDFLSTANAGQKPFSIT